jgi:MFS family permease
MMLVSSIALMSCYMNMVAYAPILGEIAQGLRVEMGAATNLMTGFVFAAAVIMIWGGVICDRYGLTAALVLGLLCASVPPTLAPWMGESYAVALVSRLVQGASAGFLIATIGPVLAMWFPLKEQGIASGVIVGCISLGSAIGFLLSPVVFEAVASWQKTVAILSIPGWIGILLALLFTRKPPNPEVIATLSEAVKSPTGEEITFGRAFTVPILWMCCFMAFSQGLGFYCLYSLVPPYLASPAPMGIGLGPVTAGKFAFVLSFAGILSPLLGGIFLDKIGKKNSRLAPWITFSIVGLFTYSILTSLVYNSNILLAICLLLAGLGTQFMSPTIVGLIANTFPPTIAGRMMGFYSGFGTFGGPVGLFLAGMAITKTGNFKLALSITPMACALGFILTFFLKTKK